MSVCGECLTEWKKAREVHEDACKPGQVVQP
jgi:hypothetical protein